MARRKHGYACSGCGKSVEFLWPKDGLPVMVDKVPATFLILDTKSKRKRTATHHAPDALMVTGQRLHAETCREGR
jgi:hypothetical protein